MVAVELARAELEDHTEQNADDEAGPHQDADAHIAFEQEVIDLSEVHGYPFQL